MNAEAIKNLVIYELSVIPSNVAVDGKNLVIEFDANDLEEGMTEEEIKVMLRKAIPFEIEVKIRR